MDEDYPDVETKLQRMGDNHGKVVELFMLRNFKKYADPSAVQGESDWHWLSVMQHHDLPTRLLDWTNSPIVALHFAIQDLKKYDKNVVVLMVNFAEAHKRNRKKGGIYLTEHDQRHASAYTVDELARKYVTLKSFDRHFPKDGIVFFEPPSIDQRIANQYALFSVMPGPHLKPQSWLKANPACYRKVIIPSHLKPMIRDFLDQMNITERVL